MIARFDLRIGRPPPLVRRPAVPGRARGRVRLLLIGLTVPFVIWLGYRLFFRPEWLSRLAPPFAELLSLGQLAGGLTLIVLWITVWWQGRIETRIRRAVSIDHLYALSPAEFEKFVARLFRRKGYQVKMRGRSGDRGVDLELNRSDGKRAVVQCKRYRNRVGPEVARELYGTLIHERAAHAFLVTTADVSEATREWTRGKPLTLIDGRTLVRVAAALADGAE